MNEKQTMPARLAFWLLATLAVFTFSAVTSCGGSGSDSTSSDQSATEETANAGAGDEIQKGKELYNQNGCAGCHGAEGRGDGDAGQALNPKPRNFHEPENYKQGTEVSDIEKTIANGIPKTAMIAYPHIPKGDRELIAKYIKSLQ